MGDGIRADRLTITPKILKLVAEIDEFKGAWIAIGRISQERLAALRRVATIESIGSSTRIEGAKLSDTEVERLLAGLDVKAFASWDEEEVAAYAEAMEILMMSVSNSTPYVRSDGSSFHQAGLDGTCPRASNLKGLQISREGEDVNHRVIIELE